MSLGQRKAGVASGPAALRAAGLAAALGVGGLTVIDQGDLHPEEAPIGSSRARNAEAIGQFCERLRRRVHWNLAIGRRCLTIGGDHSIALGTVSGSLLAHPELALVWVDAHGDFNTPASSPSGNLHGMPLAGLVGLLSAFSLPGMSWLRRALPPERIAVIGARALDREESVQLSRLGVSIFPAEWVALEGVDAVMREALGRIDPDGQRPLHLSFDIDAIDPLDAPGTGVTAPEGICAADGQDISRIVGRTGRMVAMDLVELNPALESMADAGRTAALAIDIVTAALCPALAARKIA